uniref:NADH dehydrogenase subunit 5 n=1 Tax=Spelaeomysis bottazzii TaxID=2970448 RepID=UPI002176BC0C|nr:NADH dehydrogenase subunit 5 [Spelaeomysis bottazzii]UUL70726.1 NADH dehydrogenase subunit 5 [Spelaeomysis bottazzii]
MINLQPYNLSYLLMSLLYPILFFSSIILNIKNISYILEINLMLLNSMKISFSLILDFMSLSFLSCVLFISAAIMLFSKSYIKDTNLSKFTFLLISFIISMMLLIISPNMVSLFLGWDGLGITSFILISNYDNEMSSQASVITMLSNRLGDMAILSSIGLMAFLGDWMFILNENITPLKSYSWNIITTLLIIAAFTKSAQIPFSAWLPAAMMAPTPVSALVHSSTLVTAGIYLLIRLSYLNPNINISSVFLILSLMTMMISSMTAMFHNDLKKIIALSTLSQLGLMMSTLILGFFYLTFFHLMAHALFKAMLFISGGSLIHISNNQDIRSMGMFHYNNPITSMFFNISNMALCGMFFMTGFYSKDLILESLICSPMNYWVLLSFIISSIFTISYSIRVSFISLSKNTSQQTMNIMNLMDSKTILSLVHMMLGSIIGGSMLMWILFNTPNITIISYLNTFIIPMMMTSGIMMGLFLCSKKQLKVISKYKISMFLTDLIYLYHLSTKKWILLNFNLSNKTNKYLDISWNETYFGKKMAILPLNMSNKINSMYFYNPKMMFITLMLLMFMLM